MRTKTLQMRNVKPGMVVRDEDDAFQTVIEATTEDRWTTLRYADGSDEHAPNAEQVIVELDAEPGGCTRCGYVHEADEPHLMEAPR